MKVTTTRGERETRYYCYDALYELGLARARAVWSPCAGRAGYATAMWYDRTGNDMGLGARAARVACALGVCRVHHAAVPLPAARPV